MIWKILTISAAVLSVFSLVANIGGNAGNVFGGTTAGYWNTTSGYQVNGSVIMDSSFNASSSALAASGAITGASTLTMTGETNLSTLVFGGATTSLATSGPAAVVITAANFCDNSILFFTDESASATTMYLPSASQLTGDCIPAVGDTKSTFLVIGTVDTASTTVTASTSINLLKNAVETDAILDSSAGGDGYRALITCYNYNGTEVNCKFETVIDAD